MGIGAYYTRLGSRLLRRALQDTQFTADLIDGRAKTTLSYENAFGYDVFDAICFLLSPARRSTALGFLENKEDIGSKALYGELPLNAELNFGYGVPRYVNIKTVREIAMWFRGVGSDQLASHFNIAEMRRKSVYKADSVPIRKSQSYFDQSIVPTFCEIKAFYARAALARQFVIVAIS